MRKWIMVLPTAFLFSYLIQGVATVLDVPRGLMLALYLASGFFISEALGLDK